MLGYFKIEKYLVLLLFLIISCAKKNDDNKLFQLITEKNSGINFKNSITDNDSINILTYEYLYNGGGVGIGDFNNDNLPDVIFTGNQTKSRIYLNKGNLKFEDITKTSGIDTSNKWSTGVSIVDVNQDGLDDIYISVGGMGNKSMFPNLLYINNGDLTFVESAHEYGLDDAGESIQSVFFDYDLDGDLDMYLLTGGGFEKSAITIRPILNQGEGRNTDRLYKNDYDEKKGHPVFKNVSKEAGILIEGFGLGVAVLDANNDDWPDLYISNDYLSRDFLYVNQKDGTFKEDAQSYFGHTSHFSMGNDIADINNDGLLDVLTVDMLPENVKRRKLMSGAHHSHDIFQFAYKSGYGNQHMRNMLHLNNGNNSFNEIGQLLGIDKTDWSWAPLIADFDNDGLEDIYITNGFGKDITDMDFVKFRESKSSVFKNEKDKKKSIIDCLYYRPSIKVPNYAFKNLGNYSFDNVVESWGFNTPSLSNGAAYADLDLDGDLDLLVNNINQPVFLYENTAREKDSINSNYIKIKLNGEQNNINGIGAKVSVFFKKNEKVKCNYTTRGFQSSVENVLHFGLKDTKFIDSIKVEWADGNTNYLKSVRANQKITINYLDSFKKNNNQNKDTNNHWVSQDTTLINHKYQDKTYNDFASQSLLLSKHSNQGPSLAIGDLNNDGLEDIFVGGSYGFTSNIYYQEKNGSLKKYELPETELYEDTGALIFDANNDGFMDLYISSGGTERYEGHKAYQDRIYYNHNGRLELGKLPEMLTSTSAVTGGDFDNDGDIDLFIGGRIIPGKYPLPPQSYILENKSGNFIDVTEKVCPTLKKIGMITSAVWTDFDNDNKLDLVVVGEFMPITILKGDGKALKNITALSNLENTSGMWNSLEAADFDNDGDIDFVAGNLGLNSNIKGDIEHPFKLDYADFDNNGSIDPIFSKFEVEDYYPIASLDQLINQLPLIKKKYLYYNNFAKSSTKDIINLFKTKNYNTLQGKVMTTSYIENLGNNKFKITALPVSVQIAPVNGILPEDINKDGFLDLILIGNDFGTEVGAGKYDASKGHVLINNKNGTFTVKDYDNSGFYVNGDSKSIVKIVMNNESYILVGINNQKIKSFLINNKETYSVPNLNETTAIIYFKNGYKRKHIFKLGGGYFSQSSSKIQIVPTIKKIDFFDNANNLTRSVDF